MDTNSSSQEGLSAANVVLLPGVKKAVPQPESEILTIESFINEVKDKAGVCYKMYKVLTDERGIEIFERDLRIDRSVVNALNYYLNIPFLRIKVLRKISHICFGDENYAAKNKKEEGLPKGDATIIPFNKKPQKTNQTENPYSYDAMRTFIRKKLSARDARLLVLRYVVCAMAQIELPSIEHLRDKLNFDYIDSLIKSGNGAQFKMLLDSEG